MTGVTPHDNCSRHCHRHAIAVISPAAATVAVRPSNSPPSSPRYAELQRHNKEMIKAARLELTVEDYDLASGADFMARAGIYAGLKGEGGRG